MRIHLSKSIAKRIFLIPFLCMTSHFFADAFSLDGVKYEINPDNNRTVSLILWETEVEDEYGCVPDEMYLPSEISYYGTTYKVTKIGAYAFKNKRVALRVIIPESIKTIDDYAFANSRFPYVVLPSSLTSLGDYTFLESLIQEIEIPQSVTSIGRNCFYKCERLKKVILPENVKSLGEEAFAYCTALSEIILPEGLDNIGAYAFRESAIAKLTIPKSIKAIPKNLCVRCGKLSSLVIPSSVTTIGEYAFYQCSSLDNVVIPGSVIYINESAFEGCNSLKSIYIPNSVTDLGNCAFRSCKKLEKVYIGNSVNYIGQYTFTDCNSLKTLSLGMVARIGDGAFQRTGTLDVIVSYLGGEPWIIWNHGVADSFDSRNNSAIYIKKATGGYGVESPFGYLKWQFPKSAQLPDISLSDKYISINVGMSFPLFAECPDVKYFSENNDVATVDTNGVITAVSTGKTSIIACAKVYDSYDVYFLESCAVEVPLDLSDGIETIDSENTNESDFRLYNMQGILINSHTPKPGFYIKRQGNKTEKLFIQ